MRKLSYVLAALLCIAGCSKSTGDFKGKEYSMINPQNGVEITLGFDQTEPRFFGKVVNNYFGSYELDGNKIKFGPAASTMMMGPEKEMEAEQNYLQILPRVVSWQMSGSNLVLVTNNGQEIGFKYLGDVKK